jgi:hypothetical protein
MDDQGVSVVTDRAELRAKWERFDARLSEGETEGGSLLGASFIIARTGVADVMALLDEIDQRNERLLRILARASNVVEISWSMPEQVPGSLVDTLVASIVALGEALKP